MRPFDTFQLKPFLWADEGDLRELQIAYLALSRQHHPDRADQNDPQALEESERLSSILNADYKCLKDFWKRLECVLYGASAEAAAPKGQRSSTPPELAAEYFELQEEGATAAALSEFAQKIQTRLLHFETKIVEVAQKFPLKPSGSAATTWTEKEFSDLRELHAQMRYYRSFLENIRGQIRAHSD